MAAKKSSRERAKTRIRKRLTGTDEKPRVSIFRSSRHIYAQIITDEKGATLVSASTNDEEVIGAMKKVKIEEAETRTKSKKGVIAAHAVGLVLAQRAKDKGISSVVFDRNGFVYHGRVAAVADGARAGGLKF